MRYFLSKCMCCDEVLSLPIDTKLFHLKKKKCSKDKFQLTHGPHRYLEFLYMNKFGLLKPRPKEIVYYDNICTKSVKQLMHDKCIFLSIFFNLSFNMSSFYLSNLEILK